MKRFSYRDRDYSFGQAMLTLRDTMGITQSELADLLGVSRRAVGAWEAGSKYPKAEHLKQFIVLAIQHHAFPAENEAEEVRALWQAARQKVLLNEGWLASLLTPQGGTMAAHEQPQLTPNERVPEPQSASIILPFQPTPFIGREGELAEISRILADPACRLLTLLGLGGIGKTRLAIEAAREPNARFRDGVAFVALAPISTPGQIVPAIGEALNLSFQGQAHPKSQLIDHLRTRRMLLVLDNFEHVVEGTDVVYDILLRAPQVTLLVTSRVRLNLQSEWLFDVDGLSYPSNGSSKLSELFEYSAVELFVQRATQVQPRFPVTESILRTIVNICQQVAGIPLAIELAAAGVRTLPVTEIDSQIRANMDTLTTDLRDVQARHRSLRAVFDHSWYLLSEPERALFTRLSVFRGGCTIEAVEQVTGATLPALLTLVDKSLVRQVNTQLRTNGLVEPRFFLLEPIREYGLEKLAVRGEVEALNQAHARYYLALAETAQSQWESPMAEAALEALDFDHDNMRAALQGSISGGDAMLGLRLADALGRYWRSRVYLDEAQNWLETLLALNVNQTDPAALELRMRSTYAAAMISADRHDYTHAGVLFEQSRALRHALGVGGDETAMLLNQAQQARNDGEYQRATILLQESLDLYRAGSDLGTLSSGGYGFVLYFLGHILREQGEFSRAKAFYQECYEFHLGLGDREGATQGLLGLSDVARDTGNAAELRHYINETLPTYREFGTQWAIGFCLNNLATAAYLENDLDEALALISESVAMFRAQKSSGSIAEVLVTMGAVLLARGDLDGAYNALAESVRLAWGTGPRLLIAVALEGLGCTMTSRSMTEVWQGVQFLAAAARMRQHMGTPVRLADQPVLERALATARDTLGKDDFDALWSEAGEEPLEQILSIIPGVVVGEQALPEPSTPTTHQVPVEASIPTTARPRVDWDDAVSVPVFYGREQELKSLTEWIIQDRCRVVSVLGMGGIGKSSLAVTLMRSVAEQFSLVIWRSLRDIPNCDMLSIDLVQTLAPHLALDENAGFEQRFKIILEHMRSSRILLVMDNLESVLEEGENAGHLLPGFEGFGQFLHKSAETEHQSCVLLTSREKPADLVPMEGSQSQVRTLRLSQLEVAASEILLKERGVIGSAVDYARLVEAYAGNPLALKIVAQTIVDLFDGEIVPFLEQGEVIFGSIRELLNQQFTRLSTLEQCVLLWLAILREPATLDDLLARMAVTVPRVKLLEAIESLRRRSLLERGKQQGSITLQAVVLEYITARIITHASEEIQSGNLSRVTIEHGFELAQSDEYVREIQHRLIVTLILEHLQGVFPQQVTLESHLCGLLRELATWNSSAQGYAPTNLVTLLRSLRGDLRGVDLSGLSLRNLYLQGIEMQDANLSNTFIQGTVFTETFDAVTAVATSSTGDFWATGSRRGEVRLWKADGLTLHRAWRAHTDIICSLAFSPDGRVLASTGSWDGTVKLWEVSSGALLWSAKHPSQSYNVVFSPDGRMVASTGYDAGVRIWDRKTGLELQALMHPEPVCGVRWSPDGHLLATGDLKGAIRLWEIHTDAAATLWQTLTGHTNCVETLAFSADGHTLASGSWDATVKLWDVSSGQLQRTLTEYSDRVICVAWSPDGRILASAGRDQTIWLWDTEGQGYWGTLYGHNGGVYGLAFTPDSLSLVSGSEDSTLRVWDIASARCTRFLQGYAASLYDVDWSPDNKHLVSGGSDSLVTIYSLTQDQPAFTLSGHDGFVIGVGWNTNGRWLASTEWNNMVRLWNVATGECFQVLRYAGEGGDYFDRLAWSPDGQRLATGTYTHGLQLFQPRVPGQEWVGRYFPAPTWIRHVAWRADGMQVAGGGADGFVYIWDASDGSLVQRFGEHHSSVTDIAWSPSGQRLASASRGEQGGELFIWDVPGGTDLRRFTAYPGMIYAVAWGANEDLIISAGNDGLLRTWDMQSGENVLEREGHEGTIHTLKRSSDGTKLASCGNDGAIMVWDLQNGDHLQTLRRDRPYERLNISGIRGLTRAQEANLYMLGAVQRH